jgi:hypothetical protein
MVGEMEGRAGRIMARLCLVPSESGLLHLGQESSRRESIRAVGFNRLRLPLP